MSTVSVVETFTSIQGESSYAGMPCFFMRLAGCNLRCTYCDTPRAHAGGRAVAVAALVAEAAASPAPLAEITGGEPLLQPAFAELAAALRDRTGKRVLVETNGSRDIGAIPEHVVAVMDIKCPGSGQSAAMDWDNLARLRPYDEVKFVLGNAADYEWAKALVLRDDLAARCRAVFFSPVHGALAPAELARWLVADGLPVRLQLQLHKVIGVP